MGPTYDWPFSWFDLIPHDHLSDMLWKHIQLFQTAITEVHPFQYNNTYLWVIGDKLIVVNSYSVTVKQLVPIKQRGVAFT